MSDVIIRAVDLSKVYRLYARPHYRFLDMFGLLGSTPGAYTEHRALDRVDLEIRRGEKVAFIGRNGAGKSTLLKLATSVILPTSGTIEVAEGANALLQIGVGFHSDFTGRENAYSYLAHLGITGSLADRKVLELIEFSELEEYIDQPIKTYSTGMVARLMFATSTAINPKLLVLDEILGVGDAYFAQKSYERIRELCEADGTTVLLVSHDVYSAGKLCERMVWIDRGRIIIDGDSPTVMKAYEDSIRTQESARLRKRKEARLEAIRAQGHEVVSVEICTPANRPLPAPVHFSRIALLAADHSMFELPLLDDGEFDEGKSHLVRDHGCWGQEGLWAQIRSRPMLDHGSPFHKVAGVFVVPAGVLPTDAAGLRLRMDYAMELPCELKVVCFVDGRPLELGSLPPAQGTWVSHTATVTSTGAAALPEVNTSGVHGNRRITIEDIRLVDAAGAETFLAVHLAPATLEIEYRVRDPKLREHAQVLVAFQRDGVNDICRVLTRDLWFDGEAQPAGTILMHLPRLPLANGAYAASVIVAKEHYYDSNPTKFYSINPDVYACVSRALEFEVVGGGTIGTGTGVVLDAEWKVVDRRGPLSLALEFPASVQSAFPESFPAAWRAIKDILTCIGDADLSRLARHSPGLARFDWTSYLELSVIRMVRVLQALRAYGGPTGRVLDIGAYFGNFSLMFARSGYQTDALDSYAGYGSAFGKVTQLLQSEGVRVLDFSTAGEDLCLLEEAAYDVVACMGVIEHIPHTPKPLLLAIDRLLRPGGLLVLDTPNLGYLYTREKMARGESIFCPIELQFDTEIPFEGHHREYTEDEIRWMLQHKLRHEVVHTELFNYSIYGAGTVSGHDLRNFLAMERDASLREVILSVSRKPVQPPTSSNIQ